MPAEFHFLRPEWLWALPMVVVMTVLLTRRKLAPGSWQSVVDPALAPHILSTGQIKNLNYRWWLALIGGSLAVLALAGPSWNRVEQPVFRSEQAVVIALDLSRSMDAQDLTPSRLTRARLKILDILEARKNAMRRISFLPDILEYHIICCIVLCSHIRSVKKSFIPESIHIPLEILVLITIEPASQNSVD